MRLSCIAGIALLLLGAPAEAQNRSGCGQDGFQEYMATSTALAADGSPNALIEQQRLQELYCAKFAACMAGTADTLPFRTMFASCLEDEMRAKYDIEPRKRR